MRGTRWMYSNESCLSLQVDCKSFNGTIDVAESTHSGSKADLQHNQTNGPPSLPLIDTRDPARRYVVAVPFHAMSISLSVHLTLFIELHSQQTRWMFYCCPIDAFWPLAWPHVDQLLCTHSSSYILCSCHTRTWANALIN
jgi:hypothetical protein